jgi:ferritin-like metal-binding protein YciE
LKDHYHISHRISKALEYMARLAYNKAQDDMKRGYPIETMDEFVKGKIRDIEHIINHSDKK